MSACTWLSYLSHCRRGAVSAFATCCEQRFKETHGHFRDSLPAASSADRSLPGSLNVEDLSVSISQLISPAPLAATSAAHSFRALSLPAHAIPPRIRRDSRKQELRLTGGKSTQSRCPGLSFHTFQCFSGGTSI